MNERKKEGEKEEEELKRKTNQEGKNTTWYREGK